MWSLVIKIKNKKPNCAAAVMLTAVAQSYSSFECDVSTTALYGETHSTLIPNVLGKTDKDNKYVHGRFCNRQLRSECR
jgi:hypothetical protein